MPKAGYYAVARGKVPGIYSFWPDCEAQVKGFAGAKYKKFNTLREAEEFVGTFSSSNSSGSAATPTSKGPSLPVKGKVSSMELATEESEEGYDVVNSYACKGSGQAGCAAGIDAYWGNHDPQDSAKRCTGAQTGTRAGLIAKAKASKGSFYAVARGRVPGVYTSWSECESQVHRFPGAKFKRFIARRDAEAFVDVTAFNDRLKQKLAMESVSASAEESKENYDIVYTGSACKSNDQAGSVAGIGVWWGHRDPRNIAERCPGEQTNSRAELIAIIRALEETPLPSCRPLMIKIDSEYPIRSLREWHQIWERRDWKIATDTPNLNISLVRYLVALTAYRWAWGSVVELVYVKGHAGIEGNEGADAMANEGMQHQKREERDWELKRSLVEEFVTQLENEEMVDGEGVGEVGEVMELEMLEKGIHVENMEEEVEKGSYWADAASAVTACEMNLENVHLDTATGTTELGAESLASAAAVTATIPQPPEERITPNTAEPHYELNTVDNADYSIDDILDPSELERELAEA